MRAAMKCVGVIALTAALVAGLASEAQAVIVPPDAVPTPAPYFGGVVLDSVYYPSVTGMDAGGNIFFTATVAATVVLAPNTNAYCPSGSCIDFYYQVSNISAPPPPTDVDPIQRSTHTNFAGFITDVYNIITPGILIPCPACPGGTYALGAIAPVLATHSTASTVGFEFLDLLAPGTTSLVFLIRTDATDYVPGATNLINGAIASVITFAPATNGVVPEPGQLTLFGFGLTALALVARRRKQRKADLQDSSTT
jgi:PEP-CTERM motif